MALDLQLVDISPEISVNPIDVSLVIRRNNEVSIMMISTGAEHQVPAKAGEKTGIEIQTRVKADLVLLKS